MACAIVVALFLWLVWPVRQTLSPFLPPIGKLAPERASYVIVCGVGIIVALAAWTAVWAMVPLSRLPLRSRLSALLRWTAIICVGIVCVIGVEAIVGQTWYSAELGLTIATAVLLCVEMVRRAFLNTKASLPDKSSMREGDLPPRARKM